MRRYFALLLLLGSGVCLAAPSVLVVNIDRAGASRVAALKADARVDGWVELGERLLLQADGKAARGLSDELRAEQRLLKRLPDTRLDQLAVIPRVHHLHNGQIERREGADISGVNGRWFIERAIEPAGKAGGVPLASGQVRSYQVGNRVRSKVLADNTLAALAAKVQPQRWLRTVQRLAGNDRQTERGYQGALGLVGQAFEDAGLAVSRETFDSSGLPTARSSGRNINILGFRPGTASEQVVVIGGHLDSRNANFDENQPSPGAEDNASGCAGVIETARVLQSVDTELGLLFICFGLEEYGLYGSYGHVDAAQQAGLDIVGMINMDMIGFDGDDRLDLLMDTTTVGDALTNQLAEWATTYTALEVEISHDIGRSDHSPYLDAGIPAALLIENDFELYPEYHSSGDVAELLSPAMGGEIIKLAVVGAANLAKASLDGDAWDGYWYDPAQSGQGFHVQALADGGMLVAWYTYDAAGQHYWLVGNGSVSNGVAHFALNQTENGQFPPQTTTVSYVPWGTLDIQFVDCNHANASWSPNGETGFAAGSMPLARLTQSASVDCP